MKAKTYGRLIHVTLSEKNLDDLVAQRAAGRNEPTLMRAQEDGTNLIVSVESNDLHYETRAPGPGSGLV
jgi:hypothetical protein